MTISLQPIISAFPDYTVTATQRPDGSQLLSLEKDGVQVTRVIPSPQLSAPVRVEWLLSAIRRDITQAGGVVAEIAAMQSQRQAVAQHP
ncbi:MULTISPECIES: DUF3509 domain-containing protein [Pseudomonas]|uniref:DUF3509 domain-containing protein n=1 Tax=Pseudomonas TaxID=286 RepID=UPI00249A113F|nr:MULTISPECIES: DUF3509 domain-containing protein [Pseudomonas]